VFNVESLRKSLQAKRADLIDRRDRALADVNRRSGALSANFEEQAVECENDEVLTRISESTEAEIIAINLALERLSVGTYGKCRVCGVTIDAARLEARPEADSCVGCTP